MVGRVGKPGREGERENRKGEGKRRLTCTAFAPRRGDHGMLARGTTRVAQTNTETAKEQSITDGDRHGTRATQSRAARTKSLELPAGAALVEVWPPSIVG